MRARPLITVIGLLAAAAAPRAESQPGASGQAEMRAGIRGVVMGLDRAPVPAAEITASQPGGGYQGKTRTDQQGVFRLPRIPAAETRISIRRQGFQPAEITVRPVAGQRTDLTLRLLPETAEGAPESALVEVSQTIDSREIENMPIGDRRAMNMVGMAGASVFVNYESGQKPKFSLAGGRSQSQMFTIDGGNGQSVRLGGGQIESDPPAEALSEVKVVLNGVSAEQGGSAGGMVMTRLKSGSNRLRGSVFEYLRNDRLDAPNFFAPVSGEDKLKAPLRYNVFGGALGGPIRRDRTFFFASYEGSRRREGSTRGLTVPAAAQLAGDFSTTLNTQGKLISIFDPATTRLAGGKYVRDPFPGNVIPGARIDPVARAASAFFPSPNFVPDNLTGANNFRGNSSRGFTRDHLLGKVEHQLSSRDRIGARYMFETGDQVATSIYPNPAADNQIDTFSHQQSAFGSWVRTWGPRTVNDMRLSWSNRTNHQASKGLDAGWPSKLGLTGVPETAFPRFQASGYSPLGANNQERRQFPVEQFQWLDTLAFSTGRHDFKAGFEFRPSRNVEVDLPTVSGSFVFNAQPTAMPGQSGGGNSLATMLLGFPSSFTQRETETLDRSSRYLAAFLQEKWTITPKLTLNLGVRWEIDTPIVDARNRMNGFDPLAVNPVSGTPGVVRFAGVDGWQSVPYATDWNNFGPRLGFAWRPSSQGRTVIRGGYGLYIAHPFDHSAASSASLGYELSARLVSPDSGITAPFYLRSGVPAALTSPALDAGFGAVAAGQIPTTAVTFFEPGRRSGYSHQYHLGVQRTLLGNVLVEAGWLGNLGRKLASANLSLNQIRPELMGSSASQKDRPFPQFSDVQVVLPPLGVSAYQALALRAEKRLSRGLQFMTTFTWSKFLTNADEAGEGGGADSSPYSDLYNRKADWGPSDNDIRRRFTFSSVYDLPFGPGRSRLARGWLGAVAGGWSVGSVATMQSGAPFTVITAVNSANAFSAGPLRADVLRDPVLPNSVKTLSRWFDVSAFAQPAPYTFGNPGQLVPRGDGLVNFDFSILRTFSAGERVRLQFRGELFNAFNHPNFGLPGHTLGNADFGAVDTAAPARRVQAGLRLTF